MNKTPLPSHKTKGSTRNSKTTQPTAGQTSPTHSIQKIKFQGNTLSLVNHFWPSVCKLSCSTSKVCSLGLCLASPPHAVALLSGTSRSPGRGHLHTGSHTPCTGPYCCGDTSPKGSDSTPRSSPGVVGTPNGSPGLEITENAQQKNTT